MALVDDSSRSASARSKGETRLIAFFRPELHDIMSRFPNIGTKLLMNLAGVIAARLRKTNENLIESQKVLRDHQDIAGGD